MIAYLSKSISALILFLFLGIGLKAQQYKITHYQWGQGFSATTGYSLFQDSKGYIWIGTENGLMRYNGYDFKIYTNRNGLPDNEILEIKEDAQGRIWFVPFANSICYLKNGKIHNAENDPLLKKLSMDVRPEHLFFDKQGTVWIQGRGMLIGVTTGNQIIRITKIGNSIVSHSAVVVWMNKFHELMAAICESENEIYGINPQSSTEEKFNVCCRF